MWIKLIIYKTCKLVTYPQAYILILSISLGYHTEVGFIGFMSQKASFERKCAWMILSSEDCS